MTSQKIASGKSLSTLDVNLDVRQDTPSKLQVETTPATTPVTNPLVVQINITTLSAKSGATTSVPKAILHFRYTLS